MRTPLQIIAVVLMTLIAAGAFHAQIANPIPAPVEKRGLDGRDHATSCGCPIRAACVRSIRT